jgi:hypothetical protein
MNKQKNKVILALYPNTFGIGYVICSGPKDIIDFGMKTVKSKELKAYREKIDWLFDFCKPDIVLVQDYPKNNKIVSKRTHKLLDELKTKARAQNLAIHSYTRNQIKQVFSAFKAESKYEIAMHILGWYPMLKPRKPSPRTAWMSEHYQMGVFDAFSVMLTHYYLSN